MNTVLLCGTNWWLVAGGWWLVAGGWWPGGSMYRLVISGYSLKRQRPPRKAVSALPPRRIGEVRETVPRATIPCQDVIHLKLALYTAEFVDKRRHDQALQVDRRKSGCLPCDRAPVSSTDGISTARQKTETAQRAVSTPTGEANRGGAYNCNGGPRPASRDSPPETGVLGCRSSYRRSHERLLITAGTPVGETPRRRLPVRTGRDRAAWTRSATSGRPPRQLLRPYGCDRGSRPRPI